MYKASLHYAASLTFKVTHMMSEGDNPSVHLLCSQPLTTLASHLLFQALSHALVRMCISEFFPQLGRKSHGWF